MDNMILAISYGHIIWPLSYGTNHTLHIIRYISHIVYDIRHIICRPRVIHIFSGYQTGISLEVDILYNLNGLWKQRKRNLFKSVVIISDKIVDFSEYSSGEQLFSKNEIIPFFDRGLAREKFTWQVNPFVSSQGCSKSHSSFICDAHLRQHSHSSQKIPVPGLHCGRSFFRPTETASGKSHGGHVAGHRAPLFDLYRPSWKLNWEIMNFRTVRLPVGILFLERGLWNLFLEQSGSRTSKNEVLKSFWLSDFLHT